MITIYLALTLLVFTPDITTLATGPKMPDIDAISDALGNMPNEDKCIEHVEQYTNTLTEEQEDALNDQCFDQDY